MKRRLMNRRRAVLTAASLGASSLFGSGWLEPAAQADTNIPSGTTLIVNGPTFAPTGIVLINSNAGGSPAILEFDAPDVLVSGTATIQLNAAANISARAQLNSASNVTVTLSPAITVDGFGQINANLINNGFVSADVNGADLIL